MPLGLAVGLFSIVVIVQLTVVTPAGKNEPDGGIQIDDKLPTGQLSVIVGFAYITFAPHCPGLLGTITFAGQVIRGGCASLTVTVNVQLGPAVDVQVTVVVPTGNAEPDAGEQEIVPHPVPGVGVV